MDNNNYLEKENFKHLIEGNGKDRIKDRLNIIEVFLGTEEHITFEGLYNLLKKNGYNYDPEFVQQCINQMVDLGFAQKKQFDGQPIRYEHRHLGRHHDHFICTKCGKIVEFTNEEMERLQKKIAAAYGFHMLQHRMDIYGLCNSCITQRKPIMPLSMAKSGEQVIIRKIGGGQNTHERLASMGLRVGDHIEIINNTGQGRIILGRDFTRLAIGRGIAGKIMVALINNDKEN